MMVIPIAPSLSARRAWIEILNVARRWNLDARSLSARRAWIEIRPMQGRRFAPSVALRKESVDRNSLLCSAFQFRATSLSARRAWIEIRDCWHLPVRGLSLSARRAWIEIGVAG